MKLGRLNVLVRPRAVAQTPPAAPLVDGSVYYRELTRLARALDGLPWMVVSGLAVPLTLGRFFRAHGDIDIGVPEHALREVAQAMRAGHYVLTARLFMTKLSRDRQLEIHVALDPDSRIPLRRRRHLRFWRTQDGAPLTAPGVALPYVELFLFAETEHGIDVPQHTTVPRVDPLFRWLVFLYATGTFFTFERHPFGSWEMGRNLAFNFLGFLFVLLGWRAMRLMRAAAGGVAAPGVIDRSLSAVLLVTSLCLILIGLRNVPALVFGLIGLWLWTQDQRELPSAGVVRRVLVLRHLRYMLASYFYVFTVLSLVHVTVSRDLKWLWPTLIGVPLVILATRTVASAPLRPVLGRALFYLLAVPALLGPYILVRELLLA